MLWTPNKSKREKHGITAEHVVTVLEFSLDSLFDEKPKDAIIKDMAEEIIRLRNGRENIPDKNNNIELKFFPCGLPDIDSKISYSIKKRDRIMEICSYIWCPEKMCGECFDIIAKKYK